ncbi:hypothetical protein HWV62_27642 [Athelia sp. TMB]|nr:hypothetical protein HWV62_27642 [Athelia sp. TMB]
MSRPQTSKPRGLCKYYTTPRGCFAGPQCKFLHGPDQSLTPFDQAKTCKFFASGFCRRGDECWFRHVAPGAAANASRGEEEGSEDVCNVCLEKPVTYGLLIVKKCPLCRTPSRYVIPSSVPYPHNHPEKLEAIQKYKATSNRMCPFGKDCFYAHTNADGTPHIFPHGVEYYIGRYRARLLTGQRATSRLVEGDNALDADADAYTSALIFQRLMQGAPFDDVQGTIETMRANLPGMLHDFGMELGEDGGSEDDGEDGAHYTDVSRAGIGPIHGSAEVLARLAEVMLETINNMRDRIGIPSDAHQSGDEADEMPPLEPISPSSSSSSHSEPPSLEPVPSSADTRTATSSSRFSTSIGPQRLIIELTEDEDDFPGLEEVSEDSDDDSEEDLPPLVDLSDSDAPSVDSASETESVAPMASVGTTPAPDTLAENVNALPAAQATSPPPLVDTRSTPPLEHNAEPPFLTDGRGRVVWSSTVTRPSGRTTRERDLVSTSASATPAVSGESSSREQSRVAKPRRVTAVRESVSEPAVIAESASPAFTTDGRGRVIWTGSSAPASPPVEIETEATVEGATEDGGSGGGRSLLGRVYDAVFS